MENSRSPKQQRTLLVNSFSSLAQSTRPSRSTSASTPRDTPVSLEHLNRFPYSLERLAIVPPTSHATLPSAQQERSAPVTQRVATRSEAAQRDAHAAPHPASPSRTSHIMQLRAQERAKEKVLAQHVPAKPNRTGLPAALKASAEKRSGLSMDDVRVHYNSSKPAQVQALAYTQGTEIHMGPGQEQHLAHEAWHVVQQKKGRVKATSRVHGMPLNNEAGLEHEAEQ